MVKTNFLRIFGGVLLAGVGVAIIANPVDNNWELFLGIILIASGIGILLKD